MIDYRDWDSKIFERRCGTLGDVEIPDPEKWDHVVSFTDIGDMRRLVALEKAGFTFVAERVLYKGKLADRSQVRLVRPSADEMEKIARVGALRFDLSRFAVDEALGAYAYKALHTWLMNLYKKNVLWMLPGGEGFVSGYPVLIAMSDPVRREVSISLIASLDSDRRGVGKLLMHGIMTIHGHGLPIYVRTQTKNKAACGLYKSVGLKVESVDRVHSWSSPTWTQSAVEKG